MPISISGDGAITGATTSYSFDQSVSVGGTVTYEDVTNVDSIGVITARNGIEVTGGNVHIAGVGATIGVTTAYISSINDLNYPSAGPLSNRNLIINGAMRVAQRGTGDTGVTAGPSWAADRFRLNVLSCGTWTTANTTSNLPSGFSNSIKVDCTTAKASLTGTDNCFFSQYVEAQNLVHLDYGSSTAKQITLSFWVKSNKTGDYVVELDHGDAATFNGIKYTINSANTWEYKTLTYVGDTSNAINNDNGVGLFVQWCLAAGPTLSSGTFQSNTWQTTTANRFAGQTNLADSTDNEWSITGVQLEVGTRATPFEHRSYDDELDRCWRYYQRFNFTDAQYQSITILTVPGTSTSTTGRGPIYWHKEMRAVPVCDNSADSTFRWNGGGLADQQAGSINIDQISRLNANINCVDSTSRSRTSGLSGWLSRENFDTTWIEADAELS